MRASVFVFFFLVSGDDTSVGGDACDGVRCACLGAGRLGSSVAKVTVKDLLAQAGDKRRHEKRAEVSIRWRGVWVV